MNKVDIRFVLESCLLTYIPPSVRGRYQATENFHFRTCSQFIMTSECEPPMTFRLCSSDAAEFINDFLKKWRLCKVFCKFCELVTKLTVVLIRVRKANFDVNENVLSLEFGR